jgi:hypothetical protein
LRVSPALPSVLQAMEQRASAVCSLALTVAAKEVSRVREVATPVAIAASLVVSARIQRSTTSMTRRQQRHASAGLSRGLS